MHCDAGCGSGFTQVSFRSRQDSCAAPAAVLHIGTVTVALFEDTPRELLEADMNAMQSCQEIFLDFYVLGGTRD